MMKEQEQEKVSLCAMDVWLTLFGTIDNRHIFLNISTFVIHETNDWVVKMIGFVNWVVSYHNFKFLTI